MNEKEIIDIVKKKFRHLRNAKLNKNIDLVNDLILDSLELMEFLSELENKKLISLKKFTKECKNFKVSNIIKYINKNK